ncbi:hypothetical protein DPX16_16929 [Anabarilius grahami]|uniref:Uncharacterized protein n=1 Tax=Anabarilius grahami TaxID=495550 RepID=A0A3N0YN77_ANAGA|nr:hypothetical protein DPX16_16929 [Anabarilius grahami]
MPELKEIQRYKGCHFYPVFNLEFSKTLKAGHGGGVIILCTADVALSVGSNKIAKGHRLPEKNYN